MFPWQVDFLALDDQTDVQKLRSGEYTAFYVNELQYLIKAAIRRNDIACRSLSRDQGRRPDLAWCYR